MNNLSDSESNLTTGTNLNSTYSTFKENGVENETSPTTTKTTNIQDRQSIKESYQGMITSFILFSLSFLNIADRYIVSSVLLDVQAYFNVSKSTAGCLQTIFLLVYMAFSPLNGYLGDRVNRKYLLLISIALWIASTLGGSFVDSKHFFLFVLSRCLFGVATASFEIIAVPIIGDRFVDSPKNRLRALLMFNMGAPLGTGIAYLIGIVAKDLEPNDWRFSMRFTPILLAFIFVVILFLYIEPKRGRLNEVNHSSHFLDDVRALLKNKTYVLLLFSWTAGLTSLVGFSWWSSTIIDYSLTYKQVSIESKDKLKKLYSLGQVVAGVIGLYIPCEISKAVKRKHSVDSPIDAYLLSGGFFGSSIFIYLYLVTLLDRATNIYASMVLFMLAVATFNAGWVTMAQIMLDITRPTLRSTASALIIFALHLIGDDASPYWMGLIADRCISRTTAAVTISGLLECTQLSYYPLVYVSFISAALALFMTLTFRRDRETAAQL